MARISQPTQGGVIMEYTEFIESHLESLTAYWNRVRPDLLGWKASYEWPPGVHIEEAIAKRNRLESELRNDLRTNNGWLSKQVFDAVFEWGFNTQSGLREHEIRTITEAAFHFLRQGRIVDAARGMTSPAGIGISRASKVLALSNQNNLGIYDSRSAHGLSDLVHDGRRLIPIPPGRSVVGDSRSKEQFCQAFETYIWVLRFLRDRAQQDAELREHFTRLSDLEIAFFAKSRGEAANQEMRGLTGLSDARSALDEGDYYRTLGFGGKAKGFGAHIDEDGIRVLTGPEGRTPLYLSNRDMESCLSHFAAVGWFPLGNQIDKVKENGLGEYFLKVLGVSPKFASHFASILVAQGRLTHRYGERRAIELMVTEDSRS